MKPLIFILLLSVFFSAQAQYDPAGGEPGSRAIHFQNGKIGFWADSIQLFRGWIHKGDTALGFASQGTEEHAKGPADGIPVSLGDGGYALIVLPFPIKNKSGMEFAVFENSFKFGGGYFAELAHVEVSSDGIHFARFPSVSLTDTSIQIANGETLNPEKIHNLAGKHPTFWGTPFDLEDVKGAAFLNVDSIWFIRIIDVVGDVIGNLGSTDSRGVRINDPWPTPFSSSGFDLDAVAFLREGYTGIDQVHFPWQIQNPLNAGQNIDILNLDNALIRWIAMDGRELPDESSEKLQAPQLPGFYILQIVKDQQIYSKKICVQ